MAAWISDGSPEISTSGNEVSCNLENSHGNKFNALWGEGEGATSGEHYWKVHVLTLPSEHSSIFLGITDKSKFAKGWGMKGLLYGGNLSNGGKLLVSSFGPRPKPGDVIGIFVSFEEDLVKVYFDVNGDSLGLAFQLPKNLFDGIFPVVSLGGKSSVTIEKVEQKPTSLSRSAPVYSGFEGSWQLTELRDHDALQTVGHGASIHLKKSRDNMYQATLRIMNTISFQIEFNENSGFWTSKGMMSTKIGCPPEVSALEDRFQNLFKDGFKLEPASDGLAVSQGGVVASWSRFFEEKKPVTENPF